MRNDDYFPPYRLLVHPEYDPRHIAGKFSKKIDYDLALMAAAAYDHYDPNNVQPVTPRWGTKWWIERLGVNFAPSERKALGLLLDEQPALPSIKAPRSGGLHAYLFTNGDPNDPKNVTDTNRVRVLAFKGTVNEQDWVANFKQALWSRSEQYEYGKALARAVLKLDADKRPEERIPLVALTGHSLGGGIASYAALELRNEPGGPVPAVVFEAAPPYNVTALRLGGHAEATAIASEGLIRNYVVSGEILTSALHRAGVWAPGVTIPLVDPFPFDPWDYLPTPFARTAPDVLTQATSIEPHLVHSRALHSMSAILEVMRRYPTWAAP